MSGTVLIVDDDAVLRGALAQWLDLSGFATHVADSVDAALAALDAKLYDAVLCDVRMPGRDGIELLDIARERWPGLPLVLLTGHADVPLAVDALKRGAFDFLTKPHDPDRLTATLRNACEQSRLRQRLATVEAELDGEDGVALRLAGRSAAMRHLQNEVRALLGTPLDVLVRGETGSGKEVVARVLHDFGPRRTKPFVAINCAAIPAELIESELFGHEAGTFTGARQTRIGKFEFADGGTVFLDEIESMSAAAQAKLLRVLQERVVERVGANRQIRIDVRVVSASKIDLRAAGECGAFRSDLYYRLAGYEIEIPPLRRRGDDVLMLFARFAGEAATKAARPAQMLSPAEAAQLLGHDWAGNVRELRAVAERFGLGLGLRVGSAAPETIAAGTRPPLDVQIEAYERRLITAALEESGGSVARAMEVLGLPRRTLNEKMRRHGIGRPKGEAGGDAD
jgi:two-component system C4-dicarboxylate transport response regulator DctD